MPSADQSRVVKTQQLSLYAQIPVIRHEQVLRILAGVAASQPIPIFEQHAIFQQLKQPPPSKKNQPSQAPRRTYQHLIKDVEDGVAWRHRITDVPEPGVRQVISQAVSEVVVKDADLAKFRPDSGEYQFIGIHYVRGSRFVNGNVVVTVATASQPDTAANDTLFDPPLQKSLNTPPLDPSGSYVVEATVRVEEGSSTALRDQAQKELLAFAERLKGAVDFRVPDRLALDPRVKGP